MRHPSLLVLILLLAAGSGGVAAAGPVTEATFLAAVDAAHPAARELVGELGAAEAQRLRASLLAEPRLELSREAPQDAARETTWGVGWTPPIDGRRRQAIRAAGAAVETAAHRLEGRRLELRSEVRAAYAGWAVSNARAALLGEHRDRLGELAQRMRDRADAGEESVLAAQRMEIAFQHSLVALSEARAAAAGWRERAAAWLLGTEWDLPAMQPELPELPQAPAGLSAESRPELRAARARVVEAESLERLSQRVIEAPEILLGWKSIEGEPDGGGADFEGPVFAIGWRIPIFDRNRADRLAAESAVAAAVAGEEWATRKAHSELAAATTAYEELRQSAVDAHRELGIRGGMGRAATASFELGESTVTDLLDTLRALVEARLAALDLYATALEVQRQLELAAGRTLASGDLS